ncbi:MAG: hypothetical protein AAB550_01425 [Patescibacteria group bacterium]
MQRLWWVVGFAVGAPITIVAAFILLLTTTSAPDPKPVPQSQVLGKSTSILESKQDLVPNLRLSVTSRDARILLVSNFLKKYDSPLLPFANQVIEISDKYHLDYRLLVAIAMQESGLCKKIPPMSHNCWGYGIYGDLVTKFNSYPDGMETVAKGLKKNYIDRGLDTPEEIMAKYTPPSQGSWAAGVNRVMDALE